MNAQEMDHLLALVGSIVKVPWPQRGNVEQAVWIKMRVIDVEVIRGRASLVVTPGEGILRVRRWDSL